MQTHHAVAAELQMEERYIASCRQSLVSGPVWWDTVQNDSVGHLGHHLYVTAVTHLSHKTSTSK